MSERELLFSVTASDCRFDYYRGSGKGGQKRNKTSSAVRCTHVASGAVGQSEATRSQLQNKQAAFRKMADSKRFQAWHKMEIARRCGRVDLAERATDMAMLPSNLRVEVKDQGRWIEA